MPDRARSGARMRRWMVLGFPYVLALVLVAAAFGLRMALMSQLGWREPFALFYFAILLSALYGGLGPGVLAMLVAMPLAAGFFIRPLGSLEIAYTRDWAALGFFVVLGAAICIGAEALRRAKSSIVAFRDWRDRADASLRDQRLLLQAVVDEVPALIAYLDTSLVLRLHNRCFDEWFGGTITNGMHIKDVMGSRFDDQDANAFRAALAGCRVDYERTLIHGDGSERSVRCVVLPRSGIGDTVVGVVLHMLDETESIRAQEQLIASERRFRLLVEASTSIVLRTTADGRIIEAQGWQEYVGREIPGRLSELVHHVAADDQARLAQLWSDAVGRGEAGEIELRLHHRSGMARYAVLRILPVLDEDRRVLEWVGMIRDVHDRRHAEMRLQRQERDLRLVLNTTSARISYIHADGTIRWVNRMTERWSGQSALELVGRPMSEVLGGAEGDWLSRRIRQAATGRRPVEFEWSFPHPLLGLRWSRSTVTPDLDGHGEVVGYVLLCLDITQRRAMEEELRRSEAEYRVLSEYVPHMVWIADSGGDPYFFNRQWLEYTGSEPSHPWRHIGHPDDVGHAEQAWSEALASGGDLIVEMRFRRASDTSWRWHVVRAVALKNSDGDTTRWYGTCTDIEDQKRAQKILTQAARKTDEFLGMLSHELRNPLAAISSAAGALALPAADEERRSEACDTVVRQTALMRRMVDDLLDTARVSHGKIELRLRTTDLQLLLVQIVDDYRLRLGSDAVELRLLPPDTATTAAVDAARIRQCVDNLITNAVRASRPGQVVVVGLERGRDTQELAIVVRDQGHGIEPDMLEVIFEPFVQGSSATGKLGLGLALVRKIAALHGGEVCAASKGRGQGAEFRIHLFRSGEELAQEAMPEPSFNKAHVLLIDDERDNVNALRMFLEVLGHTVDAAYDGSSGIDLAMNKRPDVIVCDLGLPPPLSGYEVARRLRDAGRTEVYLIAFSGYGRPDDIERSRRAGFDVHIVKPATPQIIDRAIQQGLAPRSRLVQ